MVSTRCLWKRAGAPFFLGCGCGCGCGQNLVLVEARFVGGHAGDRAIGHQQPARDEVALVSSGRDRLQLAAGDTHGRSPLGRLLRLGARVGIGARAGGGWGWGEGEDEGGGGRCVIGVMCDV